MRRFSRAVRRSKLEDNCEAFLKLKGINYKYEPKIFAIDKLVAKARCTECEGTRVVRRSTYTPDFFLPETNIWLETKGKLTSSNRVSYIQFKQQYPNIDLRFVFQANNRINKGSKTKYSDWAEKNGFKWTVSYKGEVPLEWCQT